MMKLVARTSSKVRPPAIFQVTSDFLFFYRILATANQITEKREPSLQLGYSIQLLFLKEAARDPDTLAMRVLTVFASER